MFVVNLVLKFKLPAKRMLYAKVDCSHLNPDAKRLNLGKWLSRCTIRLKVYEGMKLPPFKTYVLFSHEK